jgi:cytochrome c-type biogenesis protein CcmE
VNARARNRLIGVTVIVLAIIAAIFFSLSSGSSAYYKTVAEISKDPSLVGKKVQVGGPVVADSWDKKTHPMRFAITDKGGSAKLQVVYNGNVPNTFGNGVEAIVTGDLKTGGVVNATELVTKCPEKKESGATALTVDKLLGSKSQLAGVPLKVTGVLTAGSLKAAGTNPRFTIQTANGSATLSVAFDGGIPAGFTDGVAVVLGGNLDPNGVFDATSVALSK